MSASHPSPLVGRALAQAVARRLQAGEILAYRHRDYCGIGLGFIDGVFVCGEVFDGELPTADFVADWQKRGSVIEFTSFATQAAFVKWLAAQSDESLSGRHLAQSHLHDNQRLSVQRLKEFAVGNQ